jgi:serine/threonine-protein kinase
MGQVFLAENVHHKMQYAIKILPEALSQDPQFKHRFFDEARVMSKLEHPYIVRVHQIG